MEAPPNLNATTQTHRV